MCVFFSPGLKPTVLQVDVIILGGKNDIGLILK